MFCAQCITELILALTLSIIYLLTLSLIYLFVGKRILFEKYKGFSFEVFGEVIIIEILKILEIIDINNIL